MLRKISRTTILFASLYLFISCNEAHQTGFGHGVLVNHVDVAKIDRDRILTAAEQLLNDDPITVTTAACSRSLGGQHDFYSEGDYWWPNPEMPDGPYIRRDGMTNPENFTAHRKAMRQMSVRVATLAAAYKITEDEKYAIPAVKHLKAWFVDNETFMQPHMRFAQAIKGVVPGRGVGLIDGIHLVEPARAVSILRRSQAMSDTDFKAIQNWYAEFLAWMTSHEYGIDERERKNNHGTCWVMQAAEYARLTNNAEVLEHCRNRFKTVLLLNQMSPDGGFHMELKRTKPYGYSLFNIDAMAMVCHILSTQQDNLWTFELPDGRSMKKGMDFIAPYIQDKGSWPLAPDVMYWDEWPVRHPSLLFSGMALDEPDYISLWQNLVPLPESEEGLRNFPIRQPVLWY